MKYQLGTAGGRPAVKLHGDVTDRDKPVFDELQKALPNGDVTFDCDDLGTFNSPGAAVWIKFFRALPDGRRFSIVRAPDSVVAYLAVTPNFLGPARLASIYIMFVCVECQHNERRLLTRENHGEPSPCARCGRAVEPSCDPDELDRLFDKA